MALLWAEGFESGLRGNAGTTHHKWSATGASALITGSNVRTGVRALSVGGGAQNCITKVLAPSGGGIVGGAFNVASTPGSGAILFQVREGTTVHLSLEYDGSDHLVLKRGAAGTTLATGTTAVQTGGYVCIELQFTIHDTTGSYELQIDGVTEFSGSGADTRNGGAGTWDRINYVGAVTNTRLDDLYVCDDSGSAPLNTFLGPVKIETLLAQAGNGSNTGLTPSTGSDHGALVDDTLNSPDGDTTYNESASVGDKDTYNMSDMSLTGTVLAVVTVLYARKTDAAVRTVCPVIRHSGTDYDGSNIQPTTAYTWLEQVYGQNPGTSAAWASVAEVNAVEIGMKVTA